MKQSRTRNIFEKAKKSADDYSFFQKLPILLRMIKAWRQGSYKPKLINLIIAFLALFYTIIPFDFDWIPFLGWIDDVAVLGYAFSRIMKELDRFIDWENSQDSGNVIDTEATVVK